MEIKFTPDGKGGYVGREDNSDNIIGGIVGFIVLILIIGICVYCCDGSSSSTSNESYQDANNVAEVGSGVEGEGTVVTIPESCGLESLHVLDEVGFPRFYKNSVENAYGIEYQGPYLSIWGPNIKNSTETGYIANIELVAEKNYRYFSGTYFADADQPDEYTIELFVYADDELVYHSEAIDRRTQPIEFNIDIKNCNVLRIEVFTPNYYYATSDPARIAIVNGKLSK